MDLRHATWNSVNTVFAQLIRDVGVRDTAAMAKRLGITSAWESPQVHGLSYTLGAQGVSPLDMASAYSVFAARGMRAEPTPVLLVKAPNGQVLEDNTKDRANRVIDEVVADNVTDVLRGVITHGTAYPRADIGRPAAGKTGTTDNYINAWFVGFTPTLSTSVWMGYAKDQKTPLVDINGVRRVFGGTLPAQTWHDYMSQAVKDVPVTDFNQPAPIKTVAEQLNRQARRGLDAGDQTPVQDTPKGGPYQVDPPPPPAHLPASRTQPVPPPTVPPALEPATTTTTPGFIFFPRPP
jgi:penicillin-binding protein 1A